MAKKPKREPWHVACAKLLMDEYGLSKDLLDEVIDRIVAIYDNVTMPHFVIIRGIRGYALVPQTEELESYLELHKSHPPKHVKGVARRRAEFQGKYEEPDYE